MKDMNVGLIVMASGLGKRFGGNKLMEPIDEKPLIRWVLDSTEGMFEKRVVVTRSAEVKELCDELNIECIQHSFPNRNDTIRIGIKALYKDIEYCFFTQGDQPLISKESIEKLINEARTHKEKIIRASFGNVEGSPVGFPKQFFDELMNLPEGKGGNWIAQNNPSSVRLIEVQHEYELWDIDTVEDLEKIKGIKDDKSCKRW